MNSLLKGTLRFLIILVCLTGAWAQKKDKSSSSVKAAVPNTCSQSLDSAKKAFEDGRIDEVYDLLKSCLELGFSKDERIEAYKILTKTYLFYNERTKAEESMLMFLKLNPEYELKPDDPIEFVTLYNSFRTRAIYNLGLMVGLNVHDVDVVNNYSVENSGQEIGSYQSKLGFKMALALEITRWKKTSIYTELVFNQRRYLYTQEYLDFATLNFTETQRMLELPLLFKQNFGKKKSFMPYIQLGPTFHYLLSAEGDFLRKDKINSISRELKTDGASLMDQRRRLNYSFSIGGGIKLKNVISNGYIVLDFRYNHALRNMVDKQQRYDGDPTQAESGNVPVFDYLFVDPDYRMNTFQFSIGYIMPKYKPKLKKVKADDAPVFAPQSAPTPAPDKQ